MIIIPTAFSKRNGKRKFNIVQIEPRKATRRISVKKLVKFRFISINVKFIFRIVTKFRFCLLLLWTLYCTYTVHCGIPQTIAKFICSFLVLYQNPREASSRSRIFLISLKYMCLCVYLCHVSWPNEK